MFKLSDYIVSLIIITFLPYLALMCDAPNMELLSGEAALNAARTIFASTEIPAVAIDPQARAGETLQLLAFGTKSQAVIIDARTTPDLYELLQQRNEPLAAYDAKQVQRALLKTYGVGGQRWACIRITEQLLAGGNLISLELDQIAERYNVAIADASISIDAFAAHTIALAKIIQAQIPAIKRDELTYTSRIEAAAISPIAAMEHHGMPFDAVRWRDLAQQTADERAQVRAEVLRALQQHGVSLNSGLGLNNSDPDFIDCGFDLDSDQELKRALNSIGYNIPNVRRHTVAKLPSPLGPALASYRELTKINNTYGEALLAHATSDGRLHPTFEQIGASTGRMSCHTPNLQSIVKDDEHRKCFHVAVDRALVIGDYATCELRILAEMSKDPVFAEAFARGDDLHARVASRIFGKPVSKNQNPNLRERAKAVNFGLVYGMGAAGLARATGVDQQTATDLLRRYFQTFPRIGGFLAHTAKQALARGFARTLSGRRLYLQYDKNDRSSCAAAERIAKNMPIQGTSADIIKIALARLHTSLSRFNNAFLVNTVHDEIVVECDQQQAEVVSQSVHNEMQAAGAEIIKQTPIAVDVVVSDHWQK